MSTWQGEEFPGRVRGPAEDQENTSETEATLQWRGGRLVQGRGWRSKGAGRNSLQGRQADSGFYQDVRPYQRAES